ncbi:MAG: putative HNHc nuclease [Chlamydiales bacterium]
MIGKPKRIVDRKLLDSFHDRRCKACGRPGSDACHIKSKGSGGDDVWNNVIPLCRKHHCEQHSIGWRKFCSKYPSVELYLNSIGWYFDRRDRLLKE